MKIALKKGGDKKHDPIGKALENSLKQFGLPEKAKADDLVVMLAVAENLARHRNREKELRQAIALKLVTGRKAAVEEQNKSFRWLAGDEKGLEARAQPIQTMLRELSISRYLTLNYDVEIERELERSFRTSGRNQYFSSKYLSRRTAPENQHDFRSDFEDLALGSRSRVVSKLERVNSLFQSVDEIFLTEFSAKDDEFARIADLDYFDETVGFENGLGKSVQSVTLGPDNIGDLVNFALYSQEYGAQVFHLHGRYDRPAGMVLTEKDYQNTYLRSGESKETFEEALSAIFDGNDVLFVGVGMNEADFMRPLRQFVSEDRSSDFSRRHVYTLMERSCHLKADALYGSAHNFFNMHFRNGEVEETDNKADTAQSLKLNTQYGVYTLYYGNELTNDFEFPVLRFLRLSCQALHEVVANPGPRGAAGPLFFRLAGYLEALRDAKDKPTGKNNLSDERAISKKLLKPDEINHFIRVLHKVTEGLSYQERGQAKEFARALEGELRSRALDRALFELGGMRERWWEDWRMTPDERNAKFDKAYSRTDQNPPRFPNMARHRPEYSRWEFLTPQGKQQRNKPTDADVDNIGALKALRAEARKVTDNCGADIFPWRSTDQNALPASRRVVRVSMARGAGKGALLHLLRQDLYPGNKAKNRFVLDTLFDQQSCDAENGEKTFRYHGSFLLHLSFSMEFASVIDALRHFFEDALAGLLIDHKANAGKALKELVANAVSGLKPGEEMSGEARLLDAVLKHHKKVCALPKKKREKTSKLGYSQAVRDFRDKEDAKEPFRRGHRLEQLRDAMDAFQRLARETDPKLRILVVMSGLDKLCNSRGEAHNPMFRGFFRLLSGEGRKRENESNSLVPMDLVLISGSPNMPIRYLSEERPKSKVLWEAKSKGINYSASSEWHPYHDGELMLRKWPELPVLRLEERYWLRSCEEGTAFLEVLKPSEERQRGKDPKTRAYRLANQATIRTYLAQNVALSSWCLGAFKAYCTLRKTDEVKDARYGVKYVSLAAEFIKRLDDAADRAGLPGVIDLVFETHKLKWTVDASQEDKNRIWPAKPNDKANLVIAILSHLALFPMPVEPRVLYGCDEIYAQLHKMTDRRKDGAGQPDHRSRRAEAMNLLILVLGELKDHHLIIKVKPKPVTEDLGLTDLWDSVHSRYTIQHQLRDFIGYKMDLFVPDQGERNFFQLSLYCDQPRDLPTPTQEHYRLIRSLMGRQIDNCRNTLWCLYNWPKDGKWPDKASKDVRELTFEGMKRRLLPDLSGENGKIVPLADVNENEAYELDPTLASFHALPQRIRALYGLMRGGFSIGAISRLSGLADERNPDQPFERFRGWLRGITNAAISMKYNADKLDNLTGYFDENGSAICREETKAVTSPIKLPDPRNEQTHVLFRKNQLRHRIAQPLYRDEIGWLLNERGLIAFVQGQLFDAIPLFEQAAKVMRHRDDGVNSDPALNAAVRRVRVNHSIALIERGNMFKARDMIESLLLPSVGSQHPGSQVSWIGEGYLGLIRHLAGDLANAKQAYLRTIERANKEEMSRLSSIFNRHLADLYRSEDDLKSAHSAVDYATGAALQSEQRDILWYCRLSKIKIALAERSFSAQDNGRTLEGTLDYARSMGLYKLEVEALIVQAQVMLRQGERILAGRIAAQAAALANRCGLRLLKISALSIYGDALLMRQQYQLAFKVLSEVHRESERRGYQNRSGRISSLLEQIPEHTLDKRASNVH